MFGLFHQGDIIKVEKIKTPVLVVSKDFFNSSGEIIGCPIMFGESRSPLHIPVNTKEVTGYVQCEGMRMLDLRVRGCKRLDRLQSNELINIVDAIQGIFDYV